MNYTEWEIRDARRKLEALGFVVRKPGHVDIPVKVRLVEVEGRAFYELPLRVDTTINGVPYALGKGFPVEMILDEDFRKHVVPNTFAGELGRYIAERLLETLPAEMEAALAPMVAKAEEARDRMSLADIQEFIVRALLDPSFDADAWESERLAKRRKPDAPNA